MDTALSRKDLEAMLDSAVREVTETTSGISLCQGGEPPSEDFCTVHIAFKKGFRSSLSLRADTAMLARMTQNAIQEETITPQDLEDFAKEYFNVLCGRVSAYLYQATKIASRFSVPVFRWGHFEPEGQTRQFALNYCDDQRQGAQLVHHVPQPDQENASASKTTSGLV